MKTMKIATAEPKPARPTVHRLSVHWNVPTAGNLGVVCDYGEEAICYPGDFKTVTENALPPPCVRGVRGGQYTTAQNLPVCSSCNIPPAGNVSVSNCVQRTEIVVTGKLNVTGISDAQGKLPAIMGGGSNRNFFVKAGVI